MCHTGIIKFNSSLEAQAATHMTSATASLTTARAYCYAIDRDTDNNLLVSVYYSGENLTIYNFSSGAGGLNVNITTTTFGTLANSGTSGTFKTGLVKFNSSLEALWATRLNDTTNERSVIAYTTSVDRTNGFVYYGGVFVAGLSGGLELQNYTGVSGGAVQLTLFGTIPSSSTTTPGGINQAFLVKYKI